MAMKPWWPKSMGHSKSSSNKKICRNTVPPQETREFSNEQPNFIHKELEKEQRQQQWQKTPKVSRREGIIKIRAGMNEKEMERTVAKIKYT